MSMLQLIFVLAREVNKDSGGLLAQRSAYLMSPFLGRFVKKDTLSRSSTHLVQK